MAIAWARPAVPSGRSRLALGVALVLMAQSAEAASLCVNPGGTSGCSSTIQGAVDAAAPDDLIRILPGTYFENVVVGPGKDGLQIRGASRTRVILDPDVPNTGPGLQILSDRVLVANLTIRNGAASGVQLEGHGAVVQGLRILGNPDAIVATVGTTGHRIQFNEVRGGSRGVLLVGGEGSIVKGNVLANLDDVAISTGERDVQILSNEIQVAGQGGISVWGDFATIAGNSVRGAYVSLWVSGRDPVVRANQIAASGPVSVFCVDCSTGAFTANSSLGAHQTAFSVSANAPGMLVEANRVAEAYGSGLEVTGDDSIRMISNEVVDAGGPSVGCFASFGSGHVWERNTATRCPGAGFWVSGQDMSFSANVANGSGAFGFIVQGSSSSGISLTGNRAQDVRGEAFAVVDAVGTSLTGNSALKSRVDFCDSGSGTTASGNAFATASAVCDITF